METAFRKPLAIVYIELKICQVFKKDTFTGAKMKVTIIGGGSTYTPELISGFLARQQAFPLRELWLMDIATSRLETVGGFAQRMVEAVGAPFQIHLTTDQRTAIQGADYVITQLRVGGMAARRDDEYLGQRHGLIGQETTGVGGMAKALRTIPVILSVVDDMRRLAPGALLVNFTNPSGLVTEAVSRNAPDIMIIGVCNAPISAKMQLAEMLEKMRGESIDPDRVNLKTLGLNHLSWHRGLTLDGEDVWRELFEFMLDQFCTEPHPNWDIETLRALQALPNGYLQYFYYTDRKLAAQAAWPPSRAEEVMRIEADLLQQYAEPTRAEAPPGLLKRGGAFYSTVATQLLTAHYGNTGEIHVVNVPHQGAVPCYPPDWVMELPCQITRGGAIPLATEPLPLACFGLVAAVKAYELLTVDAAVTGSRTSAYQALLVHPLGPKADKVKAVLADMLATHRAYLPQFANTL